ncbi:MAG: diguanylate cyclase, partial [Nannocystaceae bacterium]|nr:diguanylate cyclase [Nannocystaceae bacterium]
MSAPTTPPPIRVLLVDDDEDDFIITRDLLSDCDGADYDVEWVSDHDTAKSRVATGSHDVCLVDYFLGAYTGLDFIEETRGSADAIPMILLTGSGCRDVDIKAMEAGAADYLLKTQLTPSLLERAIRYAMDRRRTQQDLERLARYDQLTGSLNRAFFHERLAEATCRSRRTGDPVALLFVDLDEFKPINDVHGHDTGDALLREVADRLRASVRDVDTVSRLGGDEFTVILEGMAQAPDAALAAQRILENVARPCLLADRHLQVTASVGIALYPADAENEDALIKCADMAMYRAKEHRGNAYEFFSSAMTAAATGRQHLHSRLRSALDNEEFVVHYQPLVDVATGQVQGVEALLRWQRDDTLVPPFEFIPALEYSGMIVDVGAWVLRKACHDIMDRLAGEVGPLRLA